MQNTTAAARRATKQIRDGGHWTVSTIKMSTWSLLTHSDGQYIIVALSVCLVVSTLKKCLKVRQKLGTRENLKI